MTLEQWLPFALSVVSIIFIIYGTLIKNRKWTPLGAKVLVDPENIEAWCKSEGKTKILWGIDIMFGALYYANFLIPILWAGCFIAMAIYCIYLGYENNRKYMKN